MCRLTNLLVKNVFAWISIILYNYDHNNASSLSLPFLSLSPALSPLPLSLSLTLSLSLSLSQVARRAWSGHPLAKEVSCSAATSDPQLQVTQAHDVEDDTIINKAFQ